MSYQIFTLSLILQLTLTSALPGQRKSSEPEPQSAPCTREFALDTINQQIALSRTFDNLVQRISILIRAADLLWPYQEKKARAAFAEAFEVVAYAAAPMDQFLYLSSYPFGNSRDAGQMPGYTIYKVPEGFTPNATLQRLFVRNLLVRLPTLTASPPPTDSSNQLSDAEQIWLALNRLERQIQQSSPELHDLVLRARRIVGSSIAKFIWPYQQNLE